MTSYRMKYKIGNTAYIIPSMDDLSGFGSGGGVPLGTILPYSADSPTPPEGFSFCDGTAVSRSLYADLFDLIGTSYGAGDGETTFNLPDLTDAAWLNGSYEKTAYETAGNYTFTATKPGWYKITVKGAGGGGGGGSVDGNQFTGGGGGGEGGTTFAYEYMTTGDSATVVIGAGGTGGAVHTDGGNGGNSSVTVNSNTYTGGGGGGGIGSSHYSGGGVGGTGTIVGAAGVSSDYTYSGSSAGGTGGGAGGGRGRRASAGEAGVSGGGGAGGANSSNGGKAGGDGYCWIEYIGTSQNFIIRTFDEATPSSAQIDLSQYTNALNNKADKADGVPVGTVLPFSGNGSLPAGYLLCDGSAVSRSMYEDLFGVIGTTYGEGDGVETFNLPDLGFVDGESANVYGASDAPMNLHYTPITGNSQPSSTWYLQDGNATGSLGLNNSANDTRATNIVQKGSAAPSNVYTDLTSAVSNKVRYIIKAFNGMNTHGALLDLTGMANELNRKFGDHELYGENFTIIYPNGGSKESPANITANSRYVMTNPFPGYQVECMTEVYFNNTWGAIEEMSSSGSSFYGVRSHQVGESIVTKTGSNWVLVSDYADGNPFNVGGSGVNYNNLPCRIKVWKIGKI